MSLLLRFNTPLLTKAAKLRDPLIPTCFVGQDKHNNMLLFPILSSGIGFQRLQKKNLFVIFIISLDNILDREHFGIL